MLSDLPTSPVFEQVMVPAQADEIVCIGGTGRVRDGVVEIAAAGRLPAAGKPACLVAATEEVGQRGRRSVAAPAGIDKGAVVGRREPAPQAISGRFAGHRRGNGSDPGQLAGLVAPEQGAQRDSDLHGAGRCRAGLAGKQVDQRISAALVGGTGVGGAAGSTGAGVHRSVGAGGIVGREQRPQLCHSVADRSKGDPPLGERLGVPGLGGGRVGRQHRPA